jgi:hypothetical protein
MFVAGEEHFKKMLENPFRKENVDPYIVQFLALKDTITEALQEYSEILEEYEHQETIPVFDEEAFDAATAAMLNGITLNEFMDKAHREQESADQEVVDLGNDEDDV